MKDKEVIRIAQIIGRCRLFNVKMAYNKYVRLLYDSEFETYKL